MKYTAIQILILTTMLAGSCRKYLDGKPDGRLAVPKTITDFQALLDNTSIMNITQPAGDISADAYYLLPATWTSRGLTARNLYIWDRDVFNETDNNDWSRSYGIVYYSNIVLDGYNKFSAEDPNPEWDYLKGQAHFFRAFAFHELLQEFAKPFDPATSAGDAGIPLRLNPDINIPSTRATVEQSYQQVISDATHSISLLPLTPLVKTRPSRTAAYALLARVYLNMGNYSKALLYADSALQLQSDLLDLNCTCINKNATYPFSPSNEEVILYCHQFGLGIISPTTARTDTLLYASYHQDDWRKIAYFRSNTDGSHGFKGSYAGSSANFSGLATDELYLIRAETQVRLNHVPEGLDALNALLEKRYKTGTFTPYAGLSQQQALSLILEERRKELFFRGVRWSDLRRLNKEPALAISLHRVLDNQTYTLPPNSPGYVLPIPLKVINLTGMEQNP